MSTDTWRKSSHSDTQGNMCVEVARLTQTIGIRDSKNPDGPYLRLSGGTFAEIIRRVKADDAFRAG